MVLCIFVLDVPARYQNNYATAFIRVNEGQAVLLQHDSAKLASFSPALLRL